MTAACLVSRYEARWIIGVVDMVQAYIIFISELLFSRPTLILSCRSYDSSMATTSVCSLLQIGIGIISCLSWNSYYILRCILLCQQQQHFYSKGSLI